MLVLARKYKSITYRLKGEKFYWCNLYLLLAAYLFFNTVMCLQIFCVGKQLQKLVLVNLGRQIVIKINVNIFFHLSNITVKLSSYSKMKLKMAKFNTIVRTLCFQLDEYSILAASCEHGSYEICGSLVRSCAST